MKLTVCSVLLATLLVASSSVAEAQDASSPSLARRHHAKMQHDLEKRGIFSGMATWYGWGPSSMGACGGKLPQNGFYVALNAPQYGNINAQSSMCNKQITITDGKKTTTATILDACPGDGSTCKYGSLDMSKPLFNYFNDFGVGVFNIRWWVSGEGGGDSGSSSGGSQNNDSDNSNDDSSDDSGSDNGAAQRLAAKKAQEAKDAKAAAEKKAEEKKAAKKEAAAKKAAAEKKKKHEAAIKKKKEAAAKKKAAKKAAEDKIRTAQHQNIAAFGEIMQTLNQIVESAGGQSSGSSSTPSAA